MTKREILSTFNPHTDTISHLSPTPTIKFEINLTNIPRNGKKADGELTTEEFIARHSCSPDDAVKLQQAYLEHVQPKCTHPLAICSAMLDLFKLPTLPGLPEIKIDSIPALINRFVELSQVK